MVRVQSSTYAAPLPRRTSLPQLFMILFGTERSVKSSAPRSIHLRRRSGDPVTIHLASLTSIPRLDQAPSPCGRVSKLAPSSKAGWRIITLREMTWRLTLSIDLSCVTTHGPVDEASLLPSSCSSGTPHRGTRCSWPGSAPGDRGDGVVLGPTPGRPDHARGCTCGLRPRGPARRGGAAELFPGPTGRRCTERRGV